MEPEYHLLIKYFRNECNNTEINEVEAWINASTENKKLFGELKNFWEVSGKSIDLLSPDFEKAWKNIQSQTGIKDREAEQIKLHPTIKRYLKIAALIIILLGIWIVIKVALFNEPTLKIETSLSNAKKEVHLADGTIIFLNRNSKVSFPEKFADTREVRLEGEAFFKVAKDKAHPFIVHAGGTITKVLGTSFNIKVKESGQVLVSVMTGKVTFQNKKNKSQFIHLIKGDQGKFDPGSEQLVKSHYSDENFLSWQTGIIRFNNQPLNEAVKVLSGYYSKNIEIDGSLKGRPITVTFDNLPLTEVLKILEITLNVKATAKNDSTILITNI
jgi:ferric-dicitrate binding protein FerR (iron transport regulator)